MEKDYYKKYLKYKQKYNNIKGGKIENALTTLILNEEYDKTIKHPIPMKYISLKSEDIIKKFKKTITLRDFLTEYNENKKDIKYYDDKLEDDNLFKNLEYKNSNNEENIKHYKEELIPNFSGQQLKYINYPTSYKRRLTNQINERLQEEYNLSFKNDSKFRKFNLFKNDIKSDKLINNNYKLFLKMKEDGNEEYIIFDRYSSIFNLSSYGLLNDIDMFYNNSSKNGKAAGYFNYFTFNMLSPYYYTQIFNDETKQSLEYIQEIYFTSEKDIDIPQIEVIDNEDLIKIVDISIDNTEINIDNFLNKYPISYFLKSVFVNKETINKDIRSEFFSLNDFKNKTIDKDRLLKTYTYLFTMKLRNNYLHYKTYIINYIINFLIGEKCGIINKNILTFNDIENVLIILQDIIISPEKYKIELSELYLKIYHYITKIFKLSDDYYFTSDKYTLIIYKYLDEIKKNFYNNNIFKCIFFNLLSLLYNIYYDDDDKGKVKIKDVKNMVKYYSKSFKLSDKIYDLNINYTDTFYYNIYYKYRNYLFYSYLIFLINNNLNKMLNNYSLISNKDIFNYCIHTQIKIPRNYFDEIIYFKDIDKSKIKVIFSNVEEFNFTSKFINLESNAYSDYPYINFYFLNLECNSDELNDECYNINLFKDYRYFCTINYSALEILYNDPNVKCYHNLVIGPEYTENKYFQKYFKSK